MRGRKKKEKRKTKVGVLRKKKWNKINKDGIASGQAAKRPLKKKKKKRRHPATRPGLALLCSKTPDTPCQCVAV